MRLDKISVGLCVVALFLCSSSSVLGRTTTLSGSVSAGQEFDSNIFRTDTDHEERWISSLVPSLTLLSESEKDALSVTANSNLQRDQRLDERDFVHSLSLNASREISQYLKITIGNDYSYNDGPPESDMDISIKIEDRFARANEFERGQVVRLLFSEIEEYSDEEYYIYCLSLIGERYALAEAGVVAQIDRILSNSPARRRSWENEFSISAEYEFARDSLITAGYAYSFLDDREGYYEEYGQHSPYVSLSYRFSPKWRGIMKYELTKTSNDNTDDERRHNTDLSIVHDVTTADSLTVNYSYESINYDGNRDDWNEQVASFGWGHHFAPHISLNSSLETNYLSRNMNADERGAALSLGLNRTFQRGSASLNGNVSLDERKDSGDWNKYRRNISLKGGAGYQLLEDLSGNVSLTYEKRYSWPLTGGDKAVYDDYGAGAGLSWSFGKWYALSLNYAYDRLNARDSAVSDYYEHTVMLRLTAGKDLLKWN